ncbi:hypothetical protein DFH07DRAFT_782739 [Mycena maculata]|uniref:Uncharacterized protein n=1 Tax=Mycena maculata TaxID=230809 RepID=A0AAD7HSM4_9AGAR|nr:hypothetical protein DFH07DRAFT_782739 [Mycena maculata]
MAQKEFGTAICPVFNPFLLMKWLEDSTRTYIHDKKLDSVDREFKLQLDYTETGKPVILRQRHIITSVTKTSGKIASPAVGNEKYAQARFSAKRANGLAKPTNGLASRNAGLGLGATPKSKPKPEKARLRGRKPVLQAENSGARRPYSSGARRSPDAADTAHSSRVRVACLRDAACRDRAHARTVSPKCAMRISGIKGVGEDTEFRVLMDKKKNGKKRCRERGDEGQQRGDWATRKEMGDAEDRGCQGRKAEGLIAEPPEDFFRARRARRNVLIVFPIFFLSSLRRAREVKRDTG